MSSIKIYDKIWVIKQGNFDYTNGYGTPVIFKGENDLAYMCQFENNSSFQKKKETGQKWSRNPNKNGTVYDNIPLEGFKLGKSVSRWSTSNKLFRLEDPRGFTVEISTGNLEMLMRDVTIVKGVIQGKCVWGREDGNILLSTQSQPYLDSISMGADALANRPTIKNLKIGDLVKLEKGDELVYVGKYIVSQSFRILQGTRPNNNYNYRCSSRPEYKYDSETAIEREEILKSKPCHFFEYKDYKKESAYITYSSPKILKIISSGNDVGTLSIDNNWRNANRDSPAGSPTLDKDKEWQTYYRGPKDEYIGYFKTVKIEKVS